MSEFKLEGTLYKIYPTQEVSNSFKKREFVVKTEEQYTQLVKFELTQAKCSELDNVAIGSQLTVHFNLRGREFMPQGKEEAHYFNTLQCWRIEIVQKIKNPPQTHNNTKENQETDDLPF